MSARMGTSLNRVVCMREGQVFLGTLHANTALVELELAFVHNNLLTYMSIYLCIYVGL